MLTNLCLYLANSVTKLQEQQDRPTNPQNQSLKMVDQNTSHRGGQTMVNL